MGDPNEFFIPARPQDTYYRPLKGMIRNVAPNVIPRGSVFTAKNLIHIDGALKRRPGLAKFGVDVGGNHVYMSFPVRGGCTFWKTDGNTENVMWDQRLLWVLSAPVWGARNWIYNTGSASISALGGGGGWTAATGMFTITGSGTTWNANDVAGGDVFSMASPIGVGKTFIIVAVPSATKLSLFSRVAPGVSGALRTYKIKHAFLADNPYMLDWVIADNKILFADHNRPLYAYDGAAFSAHAATYPAGAIPIAPACVSFFNNRVWMANTVENAVTRRRTIRWSLTTNHLDFRDAAGADNNWLDLRYGSGQIMKLLPLGNMMGAYLDDGIFLGVATNIPALPCDFQKVETGGIGIVGQKAVASRMGSHFFVGQDDIYAMSSRGVPEGIGSPVVSETIRKCDFPSYVQVCVDPSREQVLFAFPDIATDFSKVWSFAYKTKDWTYMEIPGTSLDSLLPASALTWNALTGTWDGLTRYSSWDAMFSKAGRMQIFIGQSSGKVFTISDTYASDEFDPASAIPVTLETGDEDYQELDTDKCWIRLSIRLREAASANISYVVSGSTNGGDSWKALGTLYIAAGQREGYVNFRMTGAQGRFKLESTSTIAPYSIIEAVLRVRGRGLQTSETAT